MASAVQICNLALSYLGDDAAVTSIRPPDGSPESQMCATFYPIAVSAMLELFDWSFATKKARLAPLATEDSFGWKGVFAVPSDCIRAIRVRDKDDFYAYDRDAYPHVGDYRIFRVGQDCAFGIEGDRLYTNARSPMLTYITSEVNEARFTPLFTTALAYYLASMIAGARVKGKEGQTIAKSIDERFRVALSEAKTKDASRQRVRLPFTPTWLRVR